MTMNSKVPEGVEHKYIDLPDVRLHYLEAGSGETILLLHGWPTSAYLWRNVMPTLANTHRVIALDLPGFGQSDKPMEASFSFNYYNKTLEAFLSTLDIDAVNLAVHDLGGPVGLYWAVRHRSMVKRLILLNTLVYPEFSGAVKLFMLATFLPLIRNWLSSPSGVKAAIRLGVYNKSQLAPLTLETYGAPFQDKLSRKVLLKSAQRLSPKGFKTIAGELPNFDIPVRIVYGINDKILPDVAKTMKRVKADLPQAESTALPNCGHFLQEDAPEKIAELLSEFVSK